MEKPSQVAGNGLLDRRAFLRGAAAITAYAVVKPAGSETLAEEAWSRSPGETLPAYGVRSPFEKNVVRTLNTKADAPGQYAVTWDGIDTSGTAVAPGVYHYRVVPQGGAIAIAAQGTLNGMTPTSHGLAYHMGDAVVRADDLVTIA